ncbi:MAG TPA: ribonuclease Z [Caldithrix abyssi]|uniref:Ribonuclease Z n=1 Tax=Caldithrix abyssi TaxID=187145 RepID=A0A7V5PQU5_CALAY|nr:ribonuclease Z [Caldithrix abyssi]
MKLTILGSGTLLSGADRAMAGYLIERQGRTALLDAGPGTLLRMAEADVNPVAVEALFISHFHPDHISDLMALLLKRHLLEPGCNRKLTIAGPAGLADWFRAQVSFQGRWLHSAFPAIKELAAGETWAEVWPVTAAPTPHTEESMALRFADDLFYSGDTDFDPDLALFARGCHTGLLECSHPDPNKIEGHLTVSETAEFARQADFKRLIVTHLYPDNDRPDLKEQLAARFSGRIEVARDLTVYSWPFDLNR